MPLDNEPLIRDMFDKAKQQAEYPRVLKIGIRDTQAVGTTANTLLITGGAVRFGIDGDNGLEDPFNEGSEEAEVDEGERRTMLLAASLQVPLSQNQIAGASLAGAAAFAGLGNIGLTTESPPIASNSFGTAVDTAAADLIEPDFHGTTLDRDLWLRSDVVAEKSSEASRGKNQINRLGFQAWAAMQISDDGKK